MTDQKPLYARLIRAHREHQLFLSQQGFAELITELAAADGVDLPCDQSTVCRWEGGDFVPALRFRKYVAQAIGLDARDIFTEVAA